MAVGEQHTEGYNNSLIVEALQSSQNEVLSPEDVAWADSCLNKDPEILDSNWTSLRDALLDILSFQPEPLKSSCASDNNFSEETDTEMLPSSEETETTNYQERVEDNDTPHTINEAETGSNDIFIRENVNPFQLSYKDEFEDIENFEFGSNLRSSENEVELSTEDIFRVWDLNSPAVEDELDKQLSNAVAESSDQLVRSSNDYSDAWTDLKEETVDDLIVGLRDLSLNHNS